MKQVWEAIDGHIFFSVAEASSHELKLFQSWKENTKEGQYISRVTETMDDTDKDEFFGTDRDLGRTFARKAFELTFRE